MNNVIGIKVNTPRFLTVTIKAVFINHEIASLCGFTENTHYVGSYDIMGKTIGENRMIFAVVYKGAN